MTADMEKGITWHDGLECWVVADPDLARMVLNQEDFSSATFQRSFDLYMSDESRARYHSLTEFLRLWFVQADGFEHTELRKPVQRQLSTGYFHDMAPMIEEIVDAALEKLAAVTPHDVIPSVADFVSSRVMVKVVGLDEEIANSLHEWSRVLSGFIGANYRLDLAEAAQRTLASMVEKLANVGAGFPRATPADRARTAATWAMILFGGLETTASLVGSALLRLLSDPEIGRVVRDGTPGAVEALVESVLETRPPLRNLARVVARDRHFAGALLRAGDLILISLVGTDLLDGSSTALQGLPMSSASRQNLSFGYGKHYCLGAPLARIEAATVLRRFASRFPDARIATNGAVWGANPSYVGLDHLYVDL
jgi:cytochrome P450